MTNVTFLPWVNPDEELAPDPLVTASGSGDFPQALSGPEALSRVVFRDEEEVPVYAEPEADLEAIEQCLLRKLGASDMSVSEVRQWLKQHDVPENDAEELIAKCERLEYLDDERLAQSLVLRLSERKGKSKSIIARDLRQRGIDSHAITQALEILSEDDELSKATELALQRVRQFSKLDQATAERRLVGFLSRRGYSGQTVREAARIALAER